MLSGLTWARYRRVKVCVFESTHTYLLLFFSLIGPNLPFSEAGAKDPSCGLVGEREHEVTLRTSSLYPTHTPTHTTCLKSTSEQYEIIK